MTAIHIANVRLYLFDDKSDYTDMGDVGCAIVATPGTPPTFRLGCYRGTEYLCTAEITPSNDTGIQLAVQGQGYVSFHDDQSRLWSMHFASDGDAVEFGAHVVVAMYGASNMPDNRIICCDVASGKRDKPIYGQDRVKVRYQTWVLSREDGIPRLGSRLEGNDHDDKAYAYNVPANHNSVTETMFGFEGMTVGMSEEGRRFVVIPQAAKKGRGPSVHTVHMIYVLKKKDNFDDPQPGARPTGQATSNQAGQQQRPNNGSFGSNPLPQGGGAGYNPQVQGPYPGQGSPYGGHNPYHHVDPHYNVGTVVAASPVPQQVVVAPPQPVVIQAPAPVMIEQPPQAMPVPPPAGFNLAQMETIQRMRDLVGTLSVALRDATGAVDMFSHDFKQHDTKTRPTSLIAAQMDHSLRTLMQETDELRGELSKRDETISSQEETYKQLQIKGEKFQKTVQLLKDEVHATVASSGENKVDLDQQMLSLQARLSRVLADREDVSRHLNTTKRLLELSDKDMREAKNQLQIAEVTLQTNEAKMAAVEESLQEERARRKLLEAKVVTLGDELRAIVDDFRVKDSSVDDRRRQMHADKLHYTQLMDDERAQAAAELRELRQELIDELAVRDRRYQEERVRVAKDSFERGRFQGIEDGEKEAKLEGDLQMQTLAFDAQRHRSELETVKVRLRQVHEQAAADRRRLEAQISALTRVVDDLNAQNQVLEVQLHDLEAAKQTVAAAAYEEVRSAVLRLTHPIGKLDLRTLIHSLRVKQPIDFSFQSTRAEEEEARASADERETRAWVRRCMTAAAAGHNPHELPPPLRWLAPQDPPVREVPPPAPNFASAPPIPSDPSSIAAAIAATEPSIDMVEVERRQKELLAALHANNPALELAPPPPPPRTPTPPRRSPTPLKRPDTPPKPVEPAPSAEADPVGAVETASHRSHSSTHQDDHDHVDAAEADEHVPNHAPQASAPAPAPAPAPAQNAHDTESDIEPPALSVPAAKRPPAPAAAPHADDVTTDDDSSAVFRPEKGPLAAPAPAPKRPPVAASDASSGDEAHRRRAAAPAKAAAKAPKAAPKPVPTRHAGLFDDDDDSASSAPNSLPRGPLVAAPTQAPAKRAPPSAGLFGGDSSDGSGDERAAPRPKQPAKAPSKAASSKFQFGDTDSEDDKPAPKPAAKRGAAAPAVTAGKKVAPRGLFESEDSS